MTGGLELRTDADGAAWDAFVGAHPHATFYQRFGWSLVIARAFGHKPHYLVALREGAVAGVLPLVEVRSRLFGASLISTAFCVGGGPLASDREVLIALTERARALGAELGVDYIELRDAPPLEGWVAREGAYAGFERAIAADEAECLKQIPRKQRAVVRKALETPELRFTIDKDASVFYRLHARTFRDHGTPVYPRRLFDTILEVFGRDADVLTVWHGKEPVSSVMSYYIGARVTPYFTGSVAAARGLGSNDLMYWRLMRHAVRRGCTSFDFGRSKVGSGPFSFKKNWGFAPRAITNYLSLVKGKSLPNVSPTNPKFSLAIKVWRALPVPVATFVSRFISSDLA